MARRKRTAKIRSDAAGTFLDAVKRVRKPMPPPEQTLADRRPRMLEEEARREIEEAPRRGDPEER